MGRVREQRRFFVFAYERWFVCHQPRHFTVGKIVASKSRNAARAREAEALRVLETSVVEIQRLAEESTRQLALTNIGTSVVQDCAVDSHRLLLDKAKSLSQPPFNFTHRGFAPRAEIASLEFEANLGIIARSYETLSVRKQEKLNFDKRLENIAREAKVEVVLRAQFADIGFELNRARDSWIPTVPVVGCSLRTRRQLEHRYKLQKAIRELNYTLVKCRDCALHCSGQAKDSGSRQCVGWRLARKSTDVFTYPLTAIDFKNKLL